MGTECNEMTFGFMLLHPFSGLDQFIVRGLGGLHKFGGCHMIRMIIVLVNKNGDILLEAFIRYDFVCPCEMSKQVCRLAESFWT